MLFPVDRFLRHDELTSLLHAAAAAHPDLLAVTSIGQSYEGREIWLATVTDEATGPHHEKPAMWVDANIHATEVTGGAAALNLIQVLLGGHGDDPKITEALRTRTFYVVPRVNPDGVEAALADIPTYLRSSTRPWPWSDRWARPGLHREDVDRDGRILSMRVPDPTGAWTPHPDDARLMVPVPLDGTDAPRYRMLDEGTIADHDGYTVPTPRPVQGLDLNRNFPAGWGTSVTGSGDFPGSEPEIQALVRAISERPNICGANAYHTFGGVLLRPSSTRADASLPPVDVWTWKQLGAVCTELTTYPVHSVYEDFTWDKSDTMSGAADDWMYEHLGVFSWTTEFWDAIHAATGERAPTSIWYVSLDPAVELAVLRWFDQHHPGLYVDWYPFDHPQLGPVELGGWDWFRSWSNPPVSRLAEEIAPHARFAITQALASPKLAVELAECEPLGEGMWRVRAGIANTGWLPTTITDWAAKHNLVLPLVAELELPDGATVHGGPVRQELGQLRGAGAARFTDHHDGTPHRVLATWIVAAPAGTSIGVTARHPRAGTARATVTLGAAAAAR